MSGGREECAKDKTGGNGAIRKYDLEWGQIKQKNEQSEKDSWSSGHAWEQEWSTGSPWNEKGEEIDRVSQGKPLFPA